MSDDIPTQRFDQVSGAPVTAPGAPPSSKRPRGPMIALIIVAALLVVAVIVVVVMLVGHNAGSLAASITAPSQTPGSSGSVSPVPAPATSTAPATAPKPVAPRKTPQPPTGAAFTTFVVPQTESGCSGGPDYTGTPPSVKVTWATVRAASAWIVQGTSDAADSGFMQLPLSGNQSDFPNEFDYPCGSSSGTFTITLVGKDGKHVSRSWTVKNTSESPSN